MVQVWNLREFQQFSGAASQRRAWDAATYIVFCGLLYRTGGKSGTSVVYT